MATLTESGYGVADKRWIAFVGDHCLAYGAMRDVATRVKLRVDADPDAQILVFDAQESTPIELDLRGSLDAVLARLPAVEAVADPVTAQDQAPARSPGRPKLGVTAREVTLLPRHWEWLAGQSGGASVALRKLVEQAMRANADMDRLRLMRESTYRFMTAMAGNAPGHEEAVRALFAGDGEKLKSTIKDWPTDIRAHVLRLLETA